MSKTLNDSASYLLTYYLLSLHALQYSFTQYTEMILNKIAKTFNKTCTGLKRTLQRFGIYFARNPRFKGVLSMYPHPIRPESGQIGPNRLCCLAGGFHTLRARISKKIYSEPLMSTL